MNQRQILTPPSSVYHPMMQQLLGLQAVAMPCCQCRSFYGFPLTFCACQCHVVYPGTRIAHWWQHQLEYQYCRLPSSGPSRNQNRIGSREAEALYRNQLIHESSGMVLEDRSTGVDPGYARIGANDKTGGGEVWRTPSKNALTVDHNLTYRKNPTTGGYVDMSTLRSSRSPLLF